MSEKAAIKTDKKRGMILKGNLYKVIITLSLPIMLSNLIQTFYNLADSYFVSRMGEIELNAVGVVWPFVFAMIGLGRGLSLGSIALISNHVGAQDEEEARKASAQSLSYLFIVGVIMGVLGYLVSPVILKWMHITGQTYEYSLQYLNIIFIGAPFMYLFFAFQSIQQAQGNMILPMILSGVSVIINIGLDPIFIFTLDLGVEGAAYATILARILLGIVSILFYFLSKKTKYKPKLSQLIPDMRIIKEISKTGVPASFGQVTSAVGFMAINSLVYSYGDNVLTAFLIGNRIVSLVMMPCMGIGNALSTIVGQNLGAGNISRTREALKKSFISSMMFALVGIVFLLILREPFIRAFTDDLNVINYANAYGLIITLAMPLMTIFNVWTGLFIGANRGTFSMIIMMTRLWIYRIPTILILKYVFHVNEYAIWIPLVISNVLACITGWVLYKRGNIFGGFANNDFKNVSIEET
ncbi:MAG: MATE family efflux transporter [Eubacteriales bacterium]